MAEKAMPANVRVLRLFGVPGEEVRQAVEAFPKEWQLTAQCMTRGGETLAVLEAGGREQEAAARLDRAQRSLQAGCPDALYGEGEATLPESTVHALVAHDKLLVCGDADAGALLEPRLEAIAGAEQMFDFGSQSYVHPKNKEKIAEGRQRYADKYPQDSIQAAAGGLQTARRLAEADLAAGCVPGAESTVLLLGGKKGFWVRAVPAQENPALWLLDMIRRAACGLEQAKGTGWVRYGAPVPPALCAVPRAEPAPSDGPAEGIPLPLVPAQEEVPPDEAAEPWHAERGGHVEQEKAACPEPDTPEAPPEAPRPKKHWLRRVLLALLLLAVLLAAAGYAAWHYVGGNMQALLEWLGLTHFNLSGASLL